MTSFEFLNFGVTDFYKGNAEYIIKSNFLILIWKISTKEALKIYYITFSTSKFWCCRFLQRKLWILLSRTVKRENSDLSITASHIMVTFGTMERCLRYSEQLAFDPVLQLPVDKKIKTHVKPFGLAHIHFIACNQFKMRFIFTKQCCSHKWNNYL